MKTAAAETEHVMKDGKRTAVILPIEEYDELLQDLDDLAVIARRKDESTIPLADAGGARVCAQGRRSESLV